MVLDSDKPETGHCFLSRKRKKHETAPIKEKTLFVIQEPNRTHLQNRVAALEFVQRKQKWMDQSSVNQDCLF